MNSEDRNNEREASDGRSSVWENLVGDTSSGTGYRYETRHTRLEQVADLASDVSTILVATTVLDTALDVAGSNLNLWGTELPVGGDEAAGPVGAIATGLLGSIFSA